MSYLFYETVILIFLIQSSQAVVIHKRCKSLTFLPTSVLLIQLIALLNISYYPNTQTIYYCFLILFVGFIVNEIALLLISLKDALAEEEELPVLALQHYRGFQ